jgi:hypothetical protein
MSVIMYRMRRCTGFRPSRASGERARVDHRIGVLEEGVLHFGLDIDVNDVLGEVFGRC